MEKGAIITELLRNAFTGVNLIPTALLILMVFYWMVAIVGVVDLEFLDFDIDLDLDGVDGSGPFYSLAIFLKVTGVPFGLVLSIIVLNFWIIAMLICLLHIRVGGLLNGILLIPGLIASVFITKFEMIPLEKIFKNANMESHNASQQIICNLCTLLCDINGGKMGQASIERNGGASIVINVKAEHADEAFNKGETAFVIKKDVEKELYYINKIKR